MAALSSGEKLSQLNSLFKEVYAPKIRDLIPEQHMILKDVEFKGGAGGSSTGGNGDYVEPVVLSRDHGISFLGNDTNVDLEAPVPPVRKDARLVAAGKVMSTQLTDIAASRINSKQTFIDNVNYLVESLMKSFTAIQEASHWYGDGGMGAFEAATADLSGNKITFAEGDFAPALWIGGETMPVDIYASTGSGIAEVITSTVVLSTTVTKVDINARQVYLTSVTGLSNGVRYIVVRKNQYGFDSKGLFQILKNSGSLFGIDAAAYPLWMANQYNVNGALNYAKVSDAISLSMGRGLVGPLELVVHSKAFRQLFPDMLTLKDTAPAATNFRAAARQIASAKEAQNVVHGTDSVMFHINGIQVKVKSCEYVQPSLGAGVNWKEFLRIGSSEIRAGSPSSPEEAFSRLESKAASQLRLFSDQSLFSSSPAQSVLFYGISLS
jgi:hypothetical protein